MVLLINSPLFLEGTCFDTEDSLPPIGLGLIATYLQKNNVHVELLDALYQKISVVELKKILSRLSPDFIGINIFTTNYDIVKDLIESIDFHTHIIIGSLSTKNLYSKIVAWKSVNQIDVVIGDGELITLDIVNGNIKIDPMVVDKNRRVFKIDQFSQYFVSDISKVELSRRFFPNEPNINQFGALEANIVTSRGCSNNCTFCAASRSMNMDYPIRERSESSIIYELKQISAEYAKIESVRILDDLFLKSSKSIEKAVSIFSNFDLQWRSMAHVKTFNQVDRTTIRSLRECGCKELFIGIESGSTRILREMNKTSDRGLIIRNLTKLFEARINIKGYFIYGFPGESEPDMRCTYELAQELKELAIKYKSSFRTSVFQFRPYHGSEIFSILEKKYNMDSLHSIPNRSLTAKIGRGQFNFQSGNFTDVCLETLHDYICRTNELNGSKVYSKRNQRVIYSKQG